MFDRPLIPRNEYLLCEGAALALWAAVLIRVLWNYLTARSFTLLPSQLFWSALLVATLYLIGSLVPRRNMPVACAIPGAVAWLAALTMAAAVTTLPELRDLWWQWLLLRRPYPLWLQVAAGVLLLVSIALRWRARRRATVITLSRGHDRTLAWVAEQPFYCRLLVRHILRSRGVVC